MNTVFPLAVTVADVNELVKVELALRDMSRAELAAAVGCSRTRLWSALRDDGDDVAAADAELRKKVVEVLTRA